MNVDALKDRVEELGPWFQQIDVGQGIKTRDLSPTPGPQVREHPLSRWELVEPLIPDDCSGMRVLDIGSAEGYFAIELAKRGADVVAVEAAGKMYDRMAWAVDHLGLSITPVLGNIYDLDDLVDGDFDLTLMLALLYHLKDPFEGLEAAARHSKVMFLETPIIRSDEPYLYLRAPIEGVHGFPKWIPTDKCVADLLGYVGFTDVEEIQNDAPKGLSADGKTERNRPIWVACKDGASWDTSTFASTG